MRRLSYRAIAAILRSNPATLHRWTHKDMSPKAQLQRQSSPFRKLTITQENILCGWLIKRDTTHKSTTTTALKTFISTHFNTSVSPSWITRFCQRHHFSIKHTTKDQHKELSTEAQLEATNFLKQIRQMKLDPSRIIAIDKSTLRGTPIRDYVKQISITGKYET